MSAGYGPTQIGDGSPDGAVFGASATEKIGFYGAAPIAQRASSDQASVATSGGTTTDIILALNEVIATLTALGLWKGGE